MNVVPTPWNDRALVIRGLAEDLDAAQWFTDAEIAHPHTFRLQKRRDEWLVSRAALKKFVVDRGLCDDPKRCTFDRPHVVIDGERTRWLASVSHSSGFVGAALARTPIGIDVQVVRGVSESAAHLFLTEVETAQMQRCTLADRLIHFWCAKEAAWKQRSNEFLTLRQVPLTLVEMRSEGLLFDSVETVRIGEMVVAVTRPPL